MSDPAAVDVRTYETADELRQELDLSQRKLAEAHKMASLGRLSAGIVHEINTPIGSILSNNETIRRSLDTLKRIITTAQAENQPLPQKVTVILDTLANLTDIDKLACERIYAVIRSLKTFARVNEGDLRKVDLHEILLNTLKLSGCVFRRRVTVVTNFTDLPEVECYPGLLNQVFLNLVVNAAQAIQGDGTITVNTRLDGEWVEIAIADSGSGIPPEVRPRIFSAGFTTKPIGEGTGLGLALTREIVEDTHGGRIWFDTEMGKGTTFTVRIPIEQPRTQEQA
ncbi:MAG TPA: ATP-binding protein [Bryobacteraceae bacterium]|nr:ATP-binding protein [Bryobacteraceae bacterium]